MQGLLQAGLINIDEFRHAQERLVPEVYLRSGYYERWLAGIELLVQEKIAAGIGAQKTAAPETRVQARFRQGDRVITKNINPPGHTRLPRYARGKRGVVDSVHGPYLVPDTNAHRLGHDWEPVYSVLFSARELWGGDAEGGRRTVSVDLWQRYLEVGG
jgi:nitrile hydratase